MSLADFTVLAKIGEGSYSSVHKVRRVSDGQTYALKKVRLLALKDKEKQNALNEVRILASIDSPYIISYKDAFIDETGNYLCLIMEYADGGDLQQKIELMSKRNLHFEESEIWRLINHLLSGLKVLHDLQIVHRDLKCANIFIAGGCYKLGDLNVSKILKRGLAYTQTGTPYYASPEVWRDEPYDSKSDIWSLGCAVYEMCALRPPFQARNMEGLYRKVQKGQFDRIPSRYSEDLQKFIGLCLQLSSSKRPTCSQLLNQPKVVGSELGDKFGDNQNLLETIKLPKNITTLKNLLPKSKYSRSTEDDNEQRIPSRKSEGIHRPNNDFVGPVLTLKKNVSERNMLPEIKPLTVPHREALSNEKNVYNEYYSRNEGKNLELLRLMKERQKEKNALMEKIKLAEQTRKEQEAKGEPRHSKQDAKESQKQQPTNGNYYSAGYSSKLPHLPDPFQRPTKPAYEYVRPSWWG